MPRLTMKKVKEKLLPEDLRLKKYDELLKDPRVSHLFSKDSKTTKQFANDLKKRYQALSKFESPQKLSNNALRSATLEPHMRKMRYSTLLRLKEFSHLNTKEEVIDHLRRKYNDSHTKAINTVRNALKKIQKNKLLLVDSAFNQNWQILKHVFSPPIVSISPEMFPNLYRTQELSLERVQIELKRRNTLNVIANRIEKVRLEREYKALKVYTILEVVIARKLIDNNHHTWINEIMYLRIKPRVILCKQDMIELINDHIIQEFVKNPYKRIIVELTSISCNIARYKPDIGGFSTFSEIPKKLANKKAIINIKNKDNKCFLYSVCAGLMLPLLPHNADLPIKYDLESTLKYKEEWFQGTSQGINVHSSQQIPWFEKMNDVRINIYSSADDGSCIYPMRLSKHKAEKVVSLYFHKNHFSLIKNFSKFAGSQGKKLHTCERCLSQFTNMVTFENHKEDCELLGGKQRVQMPKSIKDATCKFKWSSSIRMPIVIYADFEAINEKRACDSVSNTQKVTVHKAASYRFYIKSSIDLGDIPLDYDYVGLDAHQHFTRTLLSLQKPLSDIYNETVNANKQRKPLSPEESAAFMACDTCIYCKKAFHPSCKAYTGNGLYDWKDGPDDSVDLKVVDHCHYGLGAYRAAAHRSCNLKVKTPQFSCPIIFHNLNYDLRYILQSFLEIVPEEDCNRDSISVIASNSENYKTMKLNCFRFIDSFAFISTSLETLISALPDEKKTMLKKIVAHDESLFPFVNSKGEFPYEWFDDISKLTTPGTPIPSRKKFYNKLRNQQLSKEDYYRMIDCCKALEVSDFRSFHDLYLLRDVYGLCDVFEAFRDSMLEAHGLDPVHYISLPSLSWDCAMKLLGEDNAPELLLDQSMYEFYEKSIRGGISKAVHRHAKANNPYCPESYDKSKPNSFLCYYDANNLYGLAMSKPLPHSNFKWVNDLTTKQVEDLCTQWSDESSVGYTLEVDLHYPVHLHDIHSDYPLCPNHSCISEEEISPYSKDALDISGCKFNKGNRKLVCDLKDKTKYVVHIAALKLYLSLGLQLKKVHRAIRFTQKCWLKDYINFNTQKRATCTHNYEKDMYKLLNNACFGKTMEDKRSRISLRFCRTEKEFLRQTSKSHFKNVIEGVGSENFKIVNMLTPVVLLDKPIYCGSAILDFSKLHMFDHHYNVMLPHYGVDNVKLVLTDTDSFVYHITTPDVYKEMKSLIHHYDTSNYPKDHELYSTTHKKQIGFFKDELCDDSFSCMSEIVSLRSKVYAYSTSEGKEKKTLKGVNKVAKQNISLQDYKSVLETQKTVYANQTSIRSYKLVNYTIEQRKVALSCYDDKRYILPDGKQTLPYGHWRLSKSLLPCQLPTEEDTAHTSADSDSSKEESLYILADDYYEYVEDPGDMFD